MMVVDFTGYFGWKERWESDRLRLIPGCESSEVGLVWNWEFGGLRVFEKPRLANSCGMLVRNREWSRKVKDFFACVTPL